MAYNCLHDFLEKLEEAGELHRISVEVDPVLEIAEITDRVSKSPGGGKGLLFERVKGSLFQVVTNIFGSEERACQALEITCLNELSHFMEQLLEVNPTGPEDIGHCLSTSVLSQFKPVSATTGRCQEVVHDVPDLDLLPILQSWPQDGGRFITLPMVFTIDPETGSQNCGMYRTRIFSPKSAGINWGTGSGGALHQEKYRRGSERMPVAIVVGADPAVIWSATLPLPPTVDEMAFAGCLRKQPVKMIRCLTSPILVPANAELVIEGFITPGECCNEGLFGNHTGYYAIGNQVPVVQVSSISHRTDMIYPATVVGKPPMEDCYLAKATERLLLPLTRRKAPAVVDINLPMEGIFHGCAIVSINKESADHPRQTMEDIWSAGWLRRTRLLVMVDGDVDVADLSTVAWKVLNNAQWSRDVIIKDDLLGLDATAKHHTGSSKERIPLRHDPAVVRLVDEKWRHYGWK